MTTARRLLELKGVVEGGVASPQEVTEYGQLLATTQAAPAVAPPSANGTEPQDGYGDFDLNTDNFSKGWGGNVPPVNGAGVYPAVCLGVEPPQYAQTRNTGRNPIILVCTFASRAGSKPEFRGAMFISEGAEGKLKDTLDALGVRHTIMGQRRLRLLDDPKGKLCQVDWRTVDGTLRIQDVLAASKVVGQSI